MTDGQFAALSETDQKNISKFIAEKKAKLEELYRIARMISI
jgi:hypothetical protein